MKSFKQILSEASIRQGLPSINNMNHSQLSNLIGKGHIDLEHATEKTDGSSHLFGWDEKGFYSQYSGSGNEKMRIPQDFHERAQRRAQETGKEPNLGAARTFGHIHSVLQNNHALQDHLSRQYNQTGNEVKVKGEVFYLPDAKPSHVRGEVKFVGTSYHPGHMGKVGKYVIHSKLPENQSHDLDHFIRNLSSNDMNFDHDHIEGFRPSRIDVSDHARMLSQIDPEIMKSRKKDDRQERLAHEDKFNQIKQSISDKVDAHVKRMNLTSRWGSGSEGIVVHPTGDQPRFKITSDAFRKYRASDEAKNFKNRFIKECVRMIMEGGNIKIGEVSAAPFKIINRSQQASDIHDALSEIHDSFHAKTGDYLFGKNRVGLSKGSVFAGSTKHLMNKSIPDEEFTRHKPVVGDVDVQVRLDHKDALSNHLTPGSRFGKYTVIGMKKHGNENTAVMRHDNGEHHQFDFEGVDYHGHEPTKGSQFLHSSSWEDTRRGVKGAHHKILLNAVGLDRNKFSITHGVRSRIDPADPGEKEPEGVSRRLFGPQADPANITSFHGTIRSILRHIPKHQHREIYDKFKSGVSRVEGSDKALSILRQKLDLHDELKESTEQEHHVNMSYLGASPITHMGHHIDVIGSMGPGPKIVGLSGKSTHFTDEERESIANKQSGGAAKFKVSPSAGHVVGQAWNEVADKKGRKILHMHFGHDRKSFAERLKNSVEAGKIPELGDNKFDEVHVHYPADEERSHGMSGTKMRNAANERDIATFKRHMGPNISNNEAGKIMLKMKKGIDSGSVPLLREEIAPKSLKTFLKTK